VSLCEFSVSRFVAGGLFEAPNSSTNNRLYAADIMASDKCKQQTSQVASVKLLAPKKPSAASIEAAKGRRKEYLCWGFLAFAQHAGQESLRKYNMEITGDEHVDNRLLAETPSEVTGLANLRASDRRNLEQCAPTIAFVVQENCALKNQLQILKHRGEDHLQNEIAFLESSMQQRQLKHKDLCSLLNSSLQPQPQQPQQEEAKGVEGARAYAGYPPSSCMLYNSALLCYTARISEV